MYRFRDIASYLSKVADFNLLHLYWGGSVPKWLAYWTRVQKGLGSNRSHHAVRYTHRASVHQAAKLLAALVRHARITAGLVESNSSLSPVYDLRHLQAECQEPGSALEPYAH